MDNGVGGDDPTEVVAAYWNESERRLYPLAGSDPDAYKSAVTLARAVADALASVDDLEALAEQWEQRAGLVAAARQAAADPATAARFDDTEVAGVGFALRRRELLAAEAQRRHNESIAQARRRGEAWAVVHTQGEMASGLVDPYRCIELHLATGLAVVSSVEPDPLTMQPAYVVMVAALGDEHGQIADVDAASFGDLETGDAELFERNTATVKQCVADAVAELAGAGGADTDAAAVNPTDQ